MIFASQAAESARTELPGNRPPVVARLAAKSRLPSTNQISLAIGLPLRNQTELDELLGQLYDPSSTNFHKFIAPAEFTARFGPTRQDYENVIAFARTNRLRVTETYSNHLVLGVKGRVADVEGAFQVELHTYPHPTEARDFYAPNVEPSVPAGLSVISLEGLSDYSLPRHARLRKAATNRPAALNGTGPNSEYAGRDFRNAYVPGATLNGAGQSVAVLEYSDYFPVDITNYENIVGAVIGATNYVPLVKVVVGGTTPSTANNLEVALDIEVTVSMAPMLSQIYVYEDNSTTSSLLNRIATDNLAKQVSSSWTVGNWSTSLATTYDGILKNMAMQGQSFFQAAGDNDAYTGAEPLDSGVTVPVDSPYATIVGGTTLAMNGSGASWSSETVWNYNLAGIPNEGSGGGISAYYAEPSWQTNMSMAGNGGSTTFRNIPDVALTADEIFLSYNDGDDNGSSYAIGTSAAAPLWAGFCALANQLSVAADGTTLGFLNPALYNIAVSSCYPQSFHDITGGNNIGTNTAGLFKAAAGYDLCTGLGTPAGTNLIQALVWPPPNFTSQPIGRNVTNGSMVTLSAAAGSTTPLGYFWMRNGTNLAAGGNVSGTTTNTLSITAATTNNTGSYQLVASNFTGSVTSIVAVLNVGFVPTVYVTPANRTLLAGSNAVFTATPGGTVPFGYQWMKNGTNFAGTGITGTNSNVLTLADIATNSAAGYSVVVTNLFGSITSSLVTLTVVLPPSIVSSSLTNSTIQCGSNNPTFAVTAAGTPPLNFQWNLDGTPVANATNTSFSLTNLHLPNHTVSVQVTNLYASLYSNGVLTVQDTLPPVVTLNGTNPTVVELGSPFVDPGATAADLCAGAVNATASGTVNTKAVGTNTIVYTATDGNGNTNTATRTVIVRDTTPPTILWSFTNLVQAADSNCVAVMPNVTGTNFIQATDLSGVASILQSPTNDAMLPL
ncbi:MAG: protease pro-enzyme activation domain-containing protein, partial [Verrucomicrobiota bacterium]